MGIPQPNRPIGGFGHGGHRPSSSQIHSSATQIASRMAQRRAALTQHSAFAQAIAAQQSAMLTQALLAGSAIYGPTEDGPVEDTGVQVGEVIAWRTWRIEHGWLYSTTMGEVEWEPGQVMKAHKIGPQLGHGIHAFKTRKQALGYTMGGPAAVGRVALWGQIFEFESGWHGEFARVHSIDVVVGVHEPKPKRRWFEKSKPSEPTLLEQLRQIYGIEP